MQTLYRFAAGFVAFVFIFAGLTQSAFAAAPQDTYSWVKNIGTVGCSTPMYPAGVVIKNGKVYVTDSANNSVLIFDTSSAFLSSFGTGGSGNGQFNGPRGIVFDASGNILIADSSNNRIQKFDANGTYLSQFGTSGSGNGQLNYPTGIALDSTGAIYVTDTWNNRVQKFTSAGTYVSQFGTYGTGNSQFSKPYGIMIDATDSIYVDDNDNARVEKFTTAGAYVSQFSTLSNPSGITRDASGNIYVTAGQSVQKFDASGTYLSQFGSYGSGDGQFMNPYGIGFDASGNFYVADIFNNRIQKFDSNGAYLLQFKHEWSSQSDLCRPRAIARNGAGDLYVTDGGWSNVKVYRSDGTLLRVFGSAGTGNGQFSNPLSIVLDSTGNVFVLDAVQGGSRVEKFDANGTYLSQFSLAPIPGASVANTSSTALAIDRDGAIYVGLTGSSADFSAIYTVVQKYSSSGTFMSQIGSLYGTGNGQFSYISGIAFDSAANIFVVDSDNYRIQKFDANGTYLSQFGSRDNACDGTATDTFCYLDSIAIDPSNNIFIGDEDGYVKKFDANGTYLSKFGGAGAADNQFGSYEPGLTVDLNGTVYVADYSNSRISVWNAPILPSAPQNLTQSPTSSTTAKLSWSAPATTGSLSYTYTVQYRTKGSSTWTTAATNLPSSQTSYDLTGLTAGTAYDVQVIAVNVVGESPIASLSFVMGQASGLAETGSDTYVIVGIAIGATLLGSLLALNLRRFRTSTRRVRVLK